MCNKHCVTFDETKNGCPLKKEIIPDIKYPKKTIIDLITIISIQVIEIRDKLKKEKTQCLDVKYGKLLDVRTKLYENLSNTQKTSIDIITLPL